MVGLGVMGRSLLRNMADHGFSVAGYDKDPGKVEALRSESAERDIHGAADIKECIGLLRQPHAVMMLVPAGAPVDAVINDLLAHLQPGDLIIDAGNSYFKDTDVRRRSLKAKGIQFLGVGVSGGKEGARQVVCQAAESGVPVPGLMVSLGYLDAYRSAWLPANLIQAQRDYFGAHTYERVDAKGTFHTEWEKQ